MMKSHRSDAEKVILMEEGKKIGVNEVIFLVWKGVMGMFRGWVKMREFCGYSFWNLKVYKRKNVPGDSISQY